MKKFFSLAIVLLLIPFSGNVMATACSEVEAQISTKIVNNGVPEDDFDLFSIDNNADVPQGGKVVGHCEGGTKQIIYSKNTSSNKVITSSNEEKSNSANSASNTSANFDRNTSADSDINTSVDSDQNTSAETVTSPDDSDADKD